MGHLSEWINENNALVGFINSGATVVITLFTLIVTIIYVRATWKLVHFPYKSYVKPNFVKMGKHMGIWFFTVKNYGPGLAVNVEVKSEEAILIKRESNKKDVFSYTQETTLDGDTEIPFGEEKLYQLIGIPAFPIEVYISWQSITGKRYKNYWIITGGNNVHYSDPISINFLSRINKKLVRTLLQPIITLKKRNYTELNYTIYLILQRLKCDGKLSYDYISDQLTKSDTETKIIINYMRKKGYIKYYGEDAEISSAGILYLEKLDKKYNQDNGIS